MLMTMGTGKQREINNTSTTKTQTQYNRLYQNISYNSNNNRKYLIKLKRTDIYLQKKTEFSYLNTDTT